MRRDVCALKVSKTRLFERFFLFWKEGFGIEELDVGAFVELVEEPVFVPGAEGDEDGFGFGGVVAGDVVECSFDVAVVCDVDVVPAAGA